MLIDQLNVSRVLQLMVRRLSSDGALQEDLMQEALIHLWLRERGHPGQRQSWYLRSCWLHLCNCLRKGRSLDSLSHHLIRCDCSPSASISPALDEELAGQRDTRILSQVGADEIMAALSPWLTLREKRALSLLAEGFSTREVGHRLELSHTAVIKNRRKIAALALRLGITPLDGMAHSAVGASPTRAADGGVPRSVSRGSSQDLSVKITLPNAMSVILKLKLAPATYKAKKRRP